MITVHERINVDAMYPQPRAAQLMGLTVNSLATLIKENVVRAKVREPIRPSRKAGSRRVPRVLVPGREIVRYNESLPDKPAEGGMPGKPAPPPPSPPPRRGRSGDPLAGVHRF